MSAKRTGMLLCVALVQFAVGCAPSTMSPNTGDTWETWIHADEGRITGGRSTSSLSLVVTDPHRYRLPDRRLLVSVELPKTMADPTMRPAVHPFDLARRVRSAGPTNVRVDRLDPRSFDVNFPPGPDTATTWHVFALTPPPGGELPDDPVEIALEIRIPLEQLNFVRVLLGKPSTPNSRVLGAYSPAGRRATTRVIEAGEDYLGTVAAIQHIRIPAGVLRADAAAFDGMVEFTEAPFDPKRSNVDTEMLRTRRVSIGGTSPVRLIRFANRAKEPIRVATRNGEALFYSVTARLSPNAESGGFITVRPDGSYASTTSLFPILELQQVREDGTAVGPSVIIDTAITPVPGFPFYLASNGGRWSPRPPSGRMVSAESSNFFYASDVNNFFHSNGPGPGILGRCAKSSAMMF